jgi:hypothetical protein
MLSELFPILREIQQNIVGNVDTSSRKVPVISCQILKERIFSTYFQKKSSNIKFHQNPSSGSQAVPYGQTDRET